MGARLKIADTSAQDVQLAPKDKRKRYVVIAASSLLLLFLVFWYVVPAVMRWSSATISVPRDRLRIAEVVRGDLVRDVSVQGRVVAAVSPTLYAPAPGTITLKVEAGASVEQDQVLAEIYSPELENQLREAQATLEEQSMQLERQRIESKQQTLEKRKEADLANVALVAANREMRRAEDAHKRGVIPEIDYEKAKDELQNAELAEKHATADADLFDERQRFELKASEIARDRQKLRVTELQRQVDQLSIRSPVSGIVGDLLVDQRAAVTRDTPVMAVVDLSHFEIDAQIPESYADDLAIGMPAEIRLGDRVYRRTTGRRVAGDRLEPGPQPHTFRRRCTRQPAPEPAAHDADPAGGPAGRAQTAARAVPGIGRRSRRLRVARRRHSRPP